MNSGLGHCHRGSWPGPLMRSGSRCCCSPVRRSARSAEPGVLPVNLCGGAW